MTYADEVLADSPVLYYRLEETSGTTAADSSGNGNDGTVSGADLDTSGRVGSGAGFDGAGDFIDTPLDPALLDVNDVAAFEFWYWAAAGEDESRRKIISALNDESANRWDIENTGTESGINFRAYGHNGTHAGLTVPAAEQWHHGVIVVYLPSHASGPLIEYYQDGALVTTEGDDLPASFDDGANLRIAFRPDGTENSWAGRLDEVAIYDDALSAARIAAHYDARDDTGGDAVGLASETDTAQPITSAKAYALGLASSTETAQPITARKTYTIGQAAETDTAFGVTAADVTVIGQATETDQALPVTVRKTVALGLAVESDTALTLVTGEAPTPIVLPPFRETPVPDYQEAAVPAYRERAVPAYQESAS